MGFVKAQVNFVQFNRAMVDLQRVTGQTMKQVLRSETGEILAECVRKTKVAKKDVVQRKEQLGVVKEEGYTQARNKGDVSINSGWRRNAPYGRVWLRVRPSAGRKGFILARGPDFSAPSGTATLRGSGQWVTDVASAASSVLSKFPAAIARGFANIGLGRQSWIQMAESLRLNISGLIAGEDAMAARAKYQNGRGEERQGNGTYAITLINTLPYCRRAKLDAIMARAINGRATKFLSAVKQGVFQDAKKLAAKYPGLEAR